MTHVTLWIFLGSDHWCSCLCLWLSPGFLICDRRAGRGKAWAGKQSGGWGLGGCEGNWIVRLLIGGCRDSTVYSTAIKMIGVDRLTDTCLDSQLNYFVISVDEAVLHNAYFIYLENKRRQVDHRGSQISSFGNYWFLHKCSITVNLTIGLIFFCEHPLLGIK